MTEQGPLQMEQKKPLGSNDPAAGSLGQRWAGSWPAAGCGGMGSLGQGGAKEVASGLELDGAEAASWGTE